ncbi:MAG: ABC transporter permease subunit, partial [Planctomycetota bacterium]
ALLGSPRLLLLDEPINGLDPEGIQEVRTLLQRLSREDGISILLSSHQLQELEGLCTRIGVLREGSMVLEGSLDDLRRHGTRRTLVEGTDLAPLQQRLQQLELAHERDGDRLWVDQGSMASGELARHLAAAGELTAFGKEPVSIESIYLAATKQNGDGGQIGRAAASERDAVTSSAAPRARIAPPRRRAFAHELRALCLRASTKWLVAAPISFAAISAFSYQGRVQRALAAVASKERFSADSGSGHLCALQALSSSLPVLLLCMVWLGSQSIAADLQRGTLRNTLVRSVARDDVLLGKVLALAVFAAVAYALLVAASVGLSAAIFGWSDLFEVTRNGDRQPLAQALDVAPVFASALLHSLPPLLAALTIALAASALAKRSARALVLALACVLGPEFVHPFVRGYEGWLLTSHLPTPLRDDSVLRYATAIARGAADANWAYESTALTAPFSGAAAALLVAFLSFRRLRIP